MYIPTAFAETDRGKLHDFITAHSFGLLVSTRQGEPFASHLPFLLERGAGPRGTLVGHMARANPQWQDLDGQQVLAVFSGPHAYVSPSWYATAPAVPTWNYAAVHVYGTAGLLDEPRLTDLLERLVGQYESGRERPWTMDLPADYLAKMVRAVVGFEVPLARVEGKFKLSQNRPAEDRAGVIAALSAGGAEERALAEFMARFAPVD